ncbi:RIP metalloprotease RseP [Candidatus Methylomirabilis limnetica]|jgi:regulator of sigma E protease|uniref:Zinc metalloprotease n=1 Tax=Candidatus Methylomirabilis limnetica TaxID=2033718 RepID=A0A2T4U1B8_9BACT|nr:RIP metalloprotease RseP [Candidatus Methylomirabilis limnetica]PTL37167.1 RIP metalloprotease RseP [Candidatus Methylomirabilis limnetica]
MIALVTTAAFSLFDVVDPRPLLSHLDSLLWAVLVLGGLIFIHELGHFLVAKRAGVKVLKFSLGFGPKIIGITRGETEYLLSAIPLGGYVKMHGEDPKEEVADPERSFSAKSVGWRSLIILAGPGSNLLLAVAIFWVIFTISGVPVPSTRIGKILEGYPAQTAGLKTDDRILAIDGNPVDSWEDIPARISKRAGQPVQLTVEREGTKFDVTVHPKIDRVKSIFGEEEEIGRIGISQAENIVMAKANPLSAFGRAISHTYDLSRLILLTFVKLIQGVVPAKTIGGPLLVAQMAGQQARLGILYLLNFTAVLSINLAILNLLPIPILDGGHLLFSLIEAVRGKPVSLQKREMAQQVGMAMLVALMIFAFYNDIFRLLGKQ